ncbi:MAG: 3D domain-containing protein [Clostridia bacterium]|nr:3D domain-containing protein [Clostridia bacterium]
MFKKIITGLLAADFALGALATGVQKAEERTLATMSQIEERIEQHECPVIVKTRSDNYIKDSLGVFTLTFYVPDEQWGYQTATGVRSQHLATCAVDPDVIPYGSVIRIEGNNGQVLTLKAVDCGGGIVGNKIDIFYDAPNHGGVKAGYDWIAEFGEVASVYLLER